MADGRSAETAAKHPIKDPMLRQARPTLRVSTSRGSPPFVAISFPPIFNFLAASRANIIRSTIRAEKAVPDLPDLRCKGCCPQATSYRGLQYGDCWAWRWVGRRDRNPMPTRRRPVRSPISVMLGQGTLPPCSDSYRPELAESCLEWLATGWSLRSSRVPGSGRRHVDLRDTRRARVPSARCPAWHAGDDRQRQWSGADLARCPGVDQPRRPRRALHRAWQAAAKRFRRELHWPAATSS
jgi:hypothetical protein